MRWGRRITVVAAATAALVLQGAGTPGAWADGRNDPLYGDLNGDGLIDRAVLVDGAPGECGVTVELGLPSGGYDTPALYTYPQPGNINIDNYCPDMGVVVDLGGDGVVELVVTWWAGPPPGVSYDLLVLRDFTPHAGFDAMYQPSWIGLADFNGDGLQDVYEWTDQGDGFRTFLNTPSGTLEPGPVQFCSGRPDYRLADFDGDGATDVVLAYIEGCSGPFSGVVVVLDDGTQVHLQQDTFGDNYWDVEVVDADQDGTPDVATVNIFTDEVTHFIGNGDGTFTPAPTARDDVAYADRKKSGTETVIEVRDNDAATVNASVSIVVPPTYGYIVSTPEHEVVYVRTAHHRKTDTFVYQLTDDGRTDTATVTVHIDKSRTHHPKPSGRSYPE